MLLIDATRNCEVSQDSLTLKVQQAGRQIGCVQLIFLNAQQIPYYKEIPEYNGTNKVHEISNNTDRHKILSTDSNKY